MKVHVIRLFSMVRFARKAACHDDLDDDEFVTEVAESEPGVKSRRRRRRSSNFLLRLVPLFFKRTPLACTRTST